uniref:SUZ RNA-binding domain-containing n=1 Tax=Anopheles christyi TaxID=43041 RepID=A0A182JQ49_9DIPT
MSSKKQEIADSWEEIDEERLANAITILKNSTSPSAELTDSAKSSSATSGNTARQNSLPQMLEEELRPKMVVRPMQILKRPQTSGASEGKSAADSKPKTQIKSLDQRRQEYAEARLRILGSAHDDEEAETKKTTPTTNGYRVNNVNNNNSSSGNNSTNSNNASGSAGAGGSGGGSGSVGGSASAGGGGGGGAEVMAGNGANNNASNNYRFHPPYRQQAPIGTFPPAMQNGPPGRSAQGAPGLYYSSPNHLHHPHHPHHPMHSTHPLHHPFPPMPQHHLHHQHQQQQQHLNSHPYQHQQHFAPHLNHQPAGGGRDGGWFAGGRNGGNVPGTPGYYAGKGYGEGSGPMSSPLLGHAPPGAIPNHTMPYSGGSGASFGQVNSHGSTGGSNIVSNQHVLRLPAGPDGSQGFNMRR